MSFTYILPLTHPQLATPQISTNFRLHFDFQLLIPYPPQTLINHSQSNLYYSLTLKYPPKYLGLGFAPTFLSKPILFFTFSLYLLIFSPNGLYTPNWYAQTLPYTPLGTQTSHQHHPTPITRSLITLPNFFNSHLTPTPKTFHTLTNSTTPHLHPSPPI